MSPLTHAQCLAHQRGREQEECAEAHCHNAQRSLLEREDCMLVAWYRFLTHLAREGRMTVTIGRRELLVALGGAAAAWPLAARAQQPAMPVVGYLSARSPQDTTHLVEAFRRGLAEAGFVEGQNVLIEYRWAFGQHDRLPGLAADLVRNPLTVLVTTGGGGGGAGSQGRDVDDPYRLHRRHRSSQAGARSKLQPAGRQRHRDQYLDQLPGAQAARTVA